MLNGMMSRRIRMTAGWMGLYLGSLGAMGFAADQNEWLTDYHEAKSLAKQEGKPLLVAITASWCGPCRQMRQLTFQDERVKSLVGTKVLAVSVDADREPGVVSALGVAAYPTTYLFGANGELRKTWTGYQSAAEFSAELRQMIGGAAAQPERDPFGAVSALFPQNATTVAFSGFCLVSLLDDNRLRVGDDSVVTEFRGQTLQFHTLAHRDKFLKNPDRYWPVANGNCLLTEEPGDPRVGVRWQGRLWFFADRDHQQQFIRSPHRFVQNKL